MDRYFEKARILIEALPYIQRLSGKTVVIKYGGAAMLSDDLSKKIMQDITLLKYVGVNPIVVHGGGNDINKMLEKFDITAEFHNGLRVTDNATMDIVQMVLMARSTKTSSRRSALPAQRRSASAAKMPRLFRRKS